MFEMTENEFNECEQAERIKHDEKVKELEAENEQIKNSDTLCKLIGEQKIKITELEEKISVLLSCKNCPENKGGLLCQKEYEDKCLAQKIQFIKELQEENEELKGMKDVATLIRANNDTVITLMQLNNMLVSKNQQFTKSKKIIKLLLHALKNEGSDYTFALENTHPALAEAE